MTLTHRSAARSRRTIARMLPVLALALAALAVSAPGASANQGPFCPGTNGQYIDLNAYQSPNNTDRCAWAYHTHYTEVWYDNNNVAHTCAVVKANSNGSGADQGVPAVCPNSNGAAIAIIPGGGVGGYATGINHSGNYHTGFDGAIVYI